MSNKSTESLQDIDSDNLKEPPLSTPTKPQPSQSATNQNNNGSNDGKVGDIVTIFDVATEIENMLLDIVSNDSFPKHTVEKISKKLDKIEGKLKN
ncbi:hypothetical protein WICMUC_001791 [Wickerhamomyces mucosus]|uniref:Uncharacterized protein n=1 Tax=Wickerhamomyces mucosus TaxID=1378264 RepID=A0A9P8TFZ8_9ASCO|nr:hypothetical protein WICMUC_001791 [Wickerhamomyces mucosus]